MTTEDYNPCTISPKTKLKESSEMGPDARCLGESKGGVKDF